MRIGFKATNVLDAEGRPAGGTVEGTGFSIAWQNGPLGRVNPENINDERLPPNGAFVEDVIDAALQRIQHYQESGFACLENADAVGYLASALEALDSRMSRRVEEMTEGTHEGS